MNTCLLVFLYVHSISVHIHSGVQGCVGVCVLGDGHGERGCVLIRKQVIWISGLSVPV